MEYLLLYFLIEFSKLISSEFLTEYTKEVCLFEIGKKANGPFLVNICIAVCIFKSFVINNRCISKTIIVFINFFIEIFLKLSYFD